MPKAKGKSILFGAMAVFILALVLRIVHVVSIYRTSPFFAVLPGDLGAYDRWAVRIVEHGWLGKEIFYQDPLYPYFLALCYKIFGRDFFWIYMIQALLGAATSLLIVGLGRRIIAGPAAILAGLLYAFYGPAIYFDGLLLKVTLAAFLLTLAIYLFLAKDLQEPDPAHYGSGLFFGLACLTRANFLLLLPVILITALVQKNAAWNKRFGIAVLFVLGVGTALGPVVARNYLVGGELVLTTAQAGQNFYIGHNPDANGTYIKLPFVRPDPLHEQQDFKKEAEMRTGRTLSSAEASRYWLQQGIDFIMSNPLAELKLSAKKLLLFMNSYEIPDNHNYYFHQRYSGILQILPVSFGLVAPFLLLGLLGMMVARRTGAVFLFFIQTVYILSIILFFVFSRYRMVVLPLFCISAGYGVAMLLAQFRMGQVLKLAGSLVIVASGFVLTNYKVIEPFDYSHSFTDEAIAYEMKNEAAKALHSYRQALAINPTYMRALERLGKLQLQQKEYAAARITYGKILAIDPDSRTAKYQLMLLDRQGL
ncbi:MAG: glycosyltransferase family 39 protein [Desulfobulbales bacterium]|nr:glycosyltransferase family 39 protein [Desulfobulbales bacterium]